MPEPLKQSEILRSAAGDREQKLCRAIGVCTHTRQAAAELLVMPRLYCFTLGGRHGRLLTTASVGRCVASCLHPARQGQTGSEAHLAERLYCSLEG